MTRYLYPQYDAPDRFDPFENDPVVRHLRAQPERNYVPIGLREPPLQEQQPHETLRKPPIQTIANRKPPPWDQARKHLEQYTREQQRLGLAPEGIEKIFEPGPWDYDPSYWGGVRRPGDATMDYEIAE